MWMWFPIVTCAVNVLCGLPPEGWRGHYALPTEVACEGFAIDALKVINRTEDSAAIRGKYVVRCIKENPTAP